MVVSYGKYQFEKKNMIKCTNYMVAYILSFLHSHWTWSWWIEVRTRTASTWDWTQDNQNFIIKHVRASFTWEQKYEPGIPSLMQVGHWSLAAPPHPGVSQTRAETTSDIFHSPRLPPRLSPLDNGAIIYFNNLRFLTQLKLKYK